MLLISHSVIGARKTMLVPAWLILEAEATVQRPLQLFREKLPGRWTEEIKL